MNKTIGDSTFGMKALARSVLALLDSREPDFAEWNPEFKFYEVSIDTRAYYNGRETGFSLVMRPDYCGVSDNKCLVVTVTEHRNCDSICVDHWETDHGFWPEVPTPASFPEEAYHNNRKLFDQNSGKAADYIYELMEAFYKANHTFKNTEKEVANG